MARLEITQAFDRVHFEDATMVGVSVTDAQLSITLIDVALLTEHPQNPHATICTLERAALVFDAPFEAASREYAADDGEWTAPAATLDAALHTLAEVTINDGGAWHLSGFAEDGRWIAWDVTPRGAVTLHAPPPG